MTARRASLCPRRWAPRLSVLLAAWVGSAQATELPRLAIPRFTAASADQQRTAETVQQALAAELKRSALADPLGPADLEALLAPEQLRQLGTCGAEAGACVAEVVSSLGVPWVLVGRVSGGGDQPGRVELRLLRARDGKLAWRSGGGLPPVDSDFTRGLAAAVREVLSAPGLLAPGRALPGPEAVATRPTGVGPPSGPIAQWTTIGAGAALLVAGAVVSVLAGVAWGHLQSDAWRAATPWTGIRDETSTYGREVILGPSLLGGGLVMVGGGVLWLLLTRGTTLEPVTVSVQGADLVVGGRW